MALIFHFNILEDILSSENVNASHRNKMFSNYRNETFQLHRIYDKKSDFCSLKIFKVLIDCPDEQHETFPKSYSSSGNRKNLPTQFLPQRRYFILNF